MIRGTLQTETSKACLPNTLKCGVMVGCGGEERKGILFVFLCTFPRSLCSWVFFICLVPMSKTTTTKFNAFEPLVSWLNNRLICMIHCNLNIQTNYQKENVDAWFCFVFLHWILAVCNVYWIFKTVYLTFFTTLVRVVWFWTKDTLLLPQLFSLIP